MVHRKGMVRAAACAALACAGIVRAGESPSAQEQGPFYSPLMLDDATAPATDQAAAPAPPATPKPLMALLDKAGVAKPLTDTGINIYGFVEGAYNYSASAPPHNVISGRVFDTKHERIVLDQLDLTIERVIDYGAAAKAGKFDIGGRFEAIYGWDAGLIHSNGLYDNPATLGVSKGYYSSRTQPENQFDINQAYLDFAVPLGTGLRIRAGKFVTPLGAEVINPTGNALYSHSYLFGFAIPFTQTGIIGEYKINDDWLVDAGITRGWNQSLRDNNGSPDFLGTVTWTPQESDALKKWTVAVSLSEGPQGTHDNHDWWTVIDVVATYVASDKLTLKANADYGDAPHSGQWWGIAGYASYVLNPMFTLNGRAEWYDDNNGFTLGLPGADNVYEATLGVAITPFPNSDIGKNLVIRPEVRVDYSDKRFYDGGTDHYQFTAALDAYFVF
ncbi:MAG: hypothetical protein JWN24_1198 [Phycisphaerales bacterium]|nr:hypothetical protein [Phycisphaerales bacterium]